MTDLSFSTVARWKHTQWKSIDDQCFNFSVKQLIYISYPFLFLFHTHPLFKGLEVRKDRPAASQPSGQGHSLLQSSLLPPDQRGLRSCGMNWLCGAETETPPLEHISWLLEKLAFLFLPLESPSDVPVCSKGALSSWTVLVLSPVKAIWFSVVSVMPREWPSHQHSDIAQEAIFPFVLSCFLVLGFRVNVGGFVAKSWLPQVWIPLVPRYLWAGAVGFWDLHMLSPV